jgi:tryptophan-rich sensory protein
MNFGLFAIFVATCMVPGIAGMLFRPGEWYRSLNKPAWTPPNQLFPVVWAILYLSMSVAAARVGSYEGSVFAIALWGLQICINTLWSAVFFGLRRLLSGVIIIGCLCLAVAATMIAFLQYDRISVALMAPYLAWGIYAFALNVSVWKRNQDNIALA